MTKKDGRFRETPRVFDYSGCPTVNLIGQRFGKLTVAEWAGKANLCVATISMCDFWLCLCDCGNTTVAASRWIKCGNTSSCGCNQVKHKMTGTRIWTVWRGMNGRCSNPKYKDYQNYGGRGISVCDRWKESFSNFYADMGDPPTKSHTLDRINNDLGYSPENCRWATSKQQNRNRRSNRWIEWNGEVKTMAEWGEDPRLTEIGINQAYLGNRIRDGWSIDSAMTTPIFLGKAITFQGETLSMIEWSRRVGAAEGSNIVSKRLRCGWTVEQAILTPPGEKPI